MRSDGRLIGTTPLAYESSISSLITAEKKPLSELAVYAFQAFISPA